MERELLTLRLSIQWHSARMTGSHFPWSSPHTYIWALASSTLFHPLACFHLLLYSRNVLKSSIYERSSFPIPLLQIYFFLHSNTIILVESLARRVTHSYVQSMVLHQTLPYPKMLLSKIDFFVESLLNFLSTFLFLDMIFLEVKIRFCFLKKEEKKI